MSEITLGLLAGGAGSRLGGQDKGLIEVGGRRLIDHVLDRLGPGAGATLISANRNRAEYEALGSPVLPDEVGDEAWPGPVAAVITLLRHCQTPWLQLAPCDTPLLPADLTERLRATATKQTGAAVPLADGRHQWACCLLARTGLPVLEDAFADGTRRLGEAIGALPWAVVDCNDSPGAFSNINTPAELEALAARLPPAASAPDSDSEGATSR